MRNVPLRKLVIALAWVLVIFAVFAAGAGMYAAALALWPLVLVWWPWLVAGAVAVVALGAWWLWWRLPKWQVGRLRLTIRDPKARTDVEDNFRKTAGQLLGGAAVLIGAALAYLQFTQQQRASQGQFSEQQRAAQEQFTQQQQASRELLVSNQVSKGFEQLGSEKPMVRLGGIYALEGVMNNSMDYHQPVLEALCAFVRDNTRNEKGEGPPTTEIQAALTVIGRRKAIGTVTPNLSLAHIPKAQLTGANLSGADLTGADLTGADLSFTNLHGAILTGAILSSVDLSGADLTVAHLTNAHLSSADLTGAHLSSADLTAAHLTNARLIGADLIGADLTGADLTGADLTAAHLSGARLRGAKLMQAQLDQPCGTNAKLDPGLTIKPCQ
jgi:uncharacterized protein YjbI with pentapeptide repeats